MLNPGIGHLRQPKRNQAFNMGGYRTKSVSRRNSCSIPSIEPPGERVPVVELLPHGPVAPLRAAVLALRGGGVRAVEEVDVLVGRHGRQLLRGRAGVPGVHVAPPEDCLHPARERHSAVVPEHLAQAGVQALRRVVRARQRARLGQLRVQVGEQRALRDEPRQRRAGPPQPLVGEHAPAVDHRRVLEEVGPEAAPLQAALDPQLGLLERLEVQQAAREPAGLHAGLEPWARCRVPPDLAERVEDAPLDARSRPAAPHRAGESRPSVGDDALVAAADEDDEVAREPDPVDVEHAVPLAVRDGHRPHLPEPGRPAPERPSLPGHLQLGALGHEPPEELAQGGGVAVAAHRGGRPAGGAAPSLPARRRLPVPLHLRPAGRALHGLHGGPPADGF